MAKKIFCTEEDIHSFLRSAEAQIALAGTELKTKKFQTAKEKEINLSFRLDDARDGRKATLEFTKKAWIKMYALVNNFASEVEWHGTVTRIDENTFKVNDILIFPHEATGATVTTNQAEYEEWLNNLDDDTFNALRFHGHSHVDMGVSPSCVDSTYRNKVLNNFGTPNESTDLFYIFLITNKKGAISAEIYDLQNNALYDTEEITVEVEVDNDEYLCEFISEAKAAVRTKSYGYGGNTYGSGAYGGTTYNSSAPTASTNVHTTKSKQSAKFKSKSEKRRVKAQTSMTFDEDDERCEDLVDYYNQHYGGY